MALELLVTERSLLQDLVPVLAVLLSPLAALIGVWVGLRHQRGRELRDMRRAAYVEWLKAARALPYWDEPHPPQGQAIIPNPARKRRLNELTVELHLLASPAVIQAANQYIDFVAREELAAEMGGPFKNADEVVDAFARVTTDVRRDVANAMRRDLGVGDTPPPEEP